MSRSGTVTPDELVEWGDRLLSSGRARPLVMREQLRMVRYGITGKLKL